MAAGQTWKQPAQWLDSVTTDLLCTNMHINSLSTLYELYMLGTQMTSRTVKRDVKFPYEWHYRGSYFSLNVR